MIKRPQKSCEMREALSPLCIQSIDEQQEGMPIRIPSCLTPSAYQHVGKPQPFQEFFFSAELESEKLLICTDL